MSEHQDTHSTIFHLLTERSGPIAGNSQIHGKLAILYGCRLSE